MSFLGLLLGVAVIIAFLGGRKAGAAVLAGPFTFFWWGFKSIVSACGRGLEKWVGDLHKEGMRRRPFLTLSVEAGVVIFILVVLFSAGRR